jgi:hypothetical protein
MIYSDDGTMVTLTLAEFGELNGRIAVVGREMTKIASDALTKQQKAEQLLNEAMNKEANMRYQLDLKSACIVRESLVRETVRNVEGLLRALYIAENRICGDGPMKKNELEEKMRSLRGY